MERRKINEELGAAIILLADATQPTLTHTALLEKLHDAQRRVNTAIDSTMTAWEHSIDTRARNAAKREAIV